MASRTVLVLRTPRKALEKILGQNGWRMKIDPSALFSETLYSCVIFGELPR